MDQILMTPIGVVCSSRTRVEDDGWDTEQAFIELDHSTFTSDSLAGLSEFSHVEILFYMNKVDPEKIENTARHPRNNPAWPKVGIFAQRGKNRPNQIGSTISKIQKIDGLKIYLEGLDAVDGTPVLDIKPWITEFAPRGQHRQPNWITELMRNYWNESSPSLPERPTFIKHYSEIQDPDSSHYPDSDELLSIGSPFAKKFGLTQLGIHHEVLPPGRRTSWPHTESDEEEFIYVIEGNPDAWIDGHLHRLNPGDGVGFLAGTGICHTFLNNTETDVRLLVVGEATKKTNKCFYALHPKQNERAQKEGWLWQNPPQQALGNHDGIPNKSFILPTLKTSRLILEPINESHTDELYELFADQELHTFVPFEPPTREQQRQRCARWAKRKSPDGRELWLNWLARDVDTQTVVGHFQAGAKENREASIGYVVAKKFQNQGRATEALEVIFDYLKVSLGVQLVKAWSDTRNIPSHRVAQKMGMTQVEVIKNADFFKGSSSDEFVFAKKL